MAEETQKVTVRMPVSLKADLEAIALRERRAVTHQILYYLERAVEAEQKRIARKGGTASGEA